MMQSQPVDPTAFANRLVFTASARAAWHLVLEGAYREGSKVLLPAYIGITEREGSGVFDPVRQARAEHAFYALDGQLRPDHQALEAMLNTGSYSVLLVIHYFGIIQVDLERIRAICLRNGVLLVEDCAHVPVHWAPPDGLGSIGDAAFYSLHKSLPLRSGGVLRINNSKSLDVPAHFIESCEPAASDLLLKTDFSAVAAIRRANYAWLADRLTDVKGLTVLYPAIGSAVPLNLPVLIHDGLRERLYFSMVNGGFPATALYYRLIDEISPERFPHSHALSRAILNLPVHQEVNATEIAQMLRHLTQSLRDIRLSA